MTERVSFDIPDLLQPISAEAPCGRWLRYEPIYDQIREAREQDNPRFSQGIWKHPLKYANWSEVEAMCAKCLQEETKDVQVAGWLVEARMILDGMQGLIWGFDFLNQLIQQFWTKIYPYPEDPEARQFLFDWLDRTLADHLYFFAVTMPRQEFQETPLTLAEWRHAQRLDQTLRRATDPAQERHRVEIMGEPTIEWFENSYRHTDQVFFQEALNLLHILQIHMAAFKDFLTEQWGNNAPTFSNLKEVFADFERIWKKGGTYAIVPSATPTLPEEQANEQPAIPSSNIVSLNDTVDRDRAYQQIKEIADALHRLEPHGIAPHLLQRIALWKDKSFPEILRTLSENPTESALLLQLLMRDQSKTEAPPLPPPLKGES